MKKYIYLLLIIAAIGSFGCAKTVTSLVTYGDQLAVEVNLAGNVDINNNRYFLVLSSGQDFSIPLPYPNLDYDAPEFIEPEDTPTLGSKEAYYTKYFSSWEGYVVLEPGGYFLTKGPYVLNQTVTREILSNLDSISKTLTFSFRLDRIFSTVPETIYFDFVTVEWPNGQAKLPQDHISSTNAYIAKLSGSVFEITDGADASLDASLDIISLRAEIQ